MAGLVLMTGTDELPLYFFIVVLKIRLNKKTLKPLQFSTVPKSCTLLEQSAGSLFPPPMPPFPLLTEDSDRHEDQEPLARKPVPGFYLLPLTTDGSQRMMALSVCTGRGTEPQT